LIKRRFATIDLGQIHYWTAGEGKRDGGRQPIVLLHASPYSARTLNVLTEAMGRSRWAIGIAGDRSPRAEECAVAAVQAVDLVPDIVGHDPLPSYDSAGD